MLKWIFEHLGIVIFLVIFLSQIFRAVLRSKKAQAEHESTQGGDAEARRTREVQEQIRRRIAERRGGNVPAELPPPMGQEAPPVARPQTTQLPEPFGGPLGRMLEELQRRAQPAPAAPPPVLRVPVRNTAEVERQEQLAEELRLLEEQRTLTRRRAAHLAAEKKAEAESEEALRATARGHVVGDLKDPQSLRRAFVLREVLGTPVGLR